MAPIVDSESAIRRAAKERGFIGYICDDCGGSQMVRNGTCLKCNGVAQLLVALEGNSASRFDRISQPQYSGFGRVLACF